MSGTGVTTRDTEKSVIRLVDLHKYYGDGDTRLHVLKGLNLEVREGEFVALLGASGSGKSTLMNILGCLDRPTAGAYHLGGEDVAALSDDELSTIRNQNIGFIFQSFNLIAALTVMANVQVPLLYGDEPVQRFRERCLRILKAVGLDHRLTHRPPQLSGGERQRVAIARALVNDPVLLLADEPTGNLDSRTGDDVLALISDLHAQGRTVLMITHDETVAARAERQIRMHDGVLIEDQSS